MTDLQVISHHLVEATHELLVFLSVDILRSVLQHWLWFLEDT